MKIKEFSNVARTVALKKNARMVSARATGVPTTFVQRKMVVARGKKTATVNVLQRTLVVETFAPMVSVAAKMSAIVFHLVNFVSQKAPSAVAMAAWCRRRNAVLMILNAIIVSKNVTGNVVPRREFVILTSVN